MCMIDDSEPWDFFHEAERDAGKAHRCGECRRTIERGEGHTIAKGAIEGRWYTFRTCAHCVQVERWLRVVCDGFAYEAVEEDLGHHVRGQDEGYVSSSHLVRLVRWMSADWRDRRGELRPVADVEVVADRAIAAYQRQSEKAVAS